MKNFKPADQIQDLQYFGEFGGVNPSITDSSTFTFLQAGKMEEVFEKEIEGCYLYSRHWNPMNRYLSQAIAKMEGTENASVTGSGMAAITNAILQICSAGDEIVSSRTIYGGTYAFFKNFLPRFGIKTTFVDSTDMNKVKAAITNKTKVIKSLKNNEIDFALVSILPDDIALESLSLMENKLFLVGDKNVVVDSKLAPSDYIKDKSLLLREMGSATRISMEKYLTDNGIKTGMKMQLTSNEAVKQAVISGLGYSIMPLIGLKNELENGDLKIIPIPGLPIITTWRLIWLKGKAMSPAAAAYLEFLKVNKDRIRGHSFSWIEVF